MTMDEISQALAMITAQRPNGVGGVGEAFFHFLSRYTPVVNVDLLIRNEADETLFTWRADAFYGPAWHLPGGVVRYKETIRARAFEVARSELGAEIKLLTPPLGPFELFAPQRDVRGHFIAFIVLARLTSPLPAERAATEAPKPGRWRWWCGVPEPLLAEQAIYRSILQKSTQELMAAAVNAFIPAI